MTAVHDHPHTQDSHPHVHGGPPVLDIGGDIGALLALMDEDWIGHEVFVGNLDNNAETHTGVWRRSLADGQTVAAAVFLELVEGMYEVLGNPGRDREPVPIRGGELTELDLRTAG